MAELGVVDLETVLKLLPHLDGLVEKDIQMRAAELLE